MDAKQYVKNIQEKIHQLDQGQTEYLQAVFTNRRRFFRKKSSIH